MHTTAYSPHTDAKEGGCFPCRRPHGRSWFPFVSSFDTTPGLMLRKALLLVACWLVAGNIFCQTISLEKALSYYYAGEYATCIKEVNEALDDNAFLGTDDAANILNCGFLCCTAYIKQLGTQISFKDEEKMQAIISRQEEVWDNGVDFFIEMERICERHLKIEESIKTRHKYLTLLINSYSVFVAETAEEPEDDEEEPVESEAEKKLKRLYLKYIKEIYPHLKDGQMEPSDVLAGYYNVVSYFYMQGNYETLFNVMLNVAEPWFRQHVVDDGSIDRDMRLTLLQLYKSLVNLANLRMEEEQEVTGDTLASILDLNLRCKNMAYFLKGNTMYKEHLDDTWHDIRAALKDGEVAVEFCNARNYDEHIFALYFDRQSTMPKSRYCGHSYWARKDLFGFSHLMSSEEIRKYHNAYFSSTEEMAFIDMGMTDFTHKLHSLSELLMKRLESTPTPSICSFADINYTLAQTNVAVAGGNRGAVKEIAQLKGSKEELEFLRTKDGHRLTAYDKDNATKAAFQSLSHKAIDILHVSTHGFFNREGSTAAILGSAISAVTGAAVLSNCGLILSGFNDGTDNSVITGEEIAMMDLSKTGLVILNACETGLGDLRAGDIYSLTEAFHQAGVRYIISTTDKIGDNAARTFFVTFMNEVYAGASYHDAFVKARSASGTPDKFIFWE